MGADAQQTVAALRSAARVAGIVSALAAVAALVVTVAFAAVASEPPDAYRDLGMEILPLPSSARTWAASRKVVAAATVFAVGVGLLASLSFGLGRFARTGRLPRRRSALAVMAAPPVTVFAVLASLLVSDRGDARLTPDCATFRFDRTAFLSTDRNTWQPQAIGLKECRPVEGRTASQMRRLLGDPDPRRPDQIRSAWVYHDGLFTVQFNGGRALFLEVVVA